MSTPTDIYAALVRRFGKDAVDAALAEYDMREMVFSDSSRYIGQHFEGEGWIIQSAPVALAVLESVGEAMLMDAGTPIYRYWCNLTHKFVYSHGALVALNHSPRPPVVSDTKAAALVAACGGTK